MYHIQLEELLLQYILTLIWREQRAQHVIALICRLRILVYMQDLTAEFPDSDWISATAALAQYNLRNFDEAQELYEDLLESDPHRIDVSPFPLTHPHSNLPAAGSLRERA